LTQRREKASDVFKQGGYLLDQRATFAEVFPEIQTLQLEVKELGKGCRSGSVRTYTHERFPGEFVNCSNSLCYNGGVSVAAVVHEAYRQRLTGHAVTRWCQGFNGSPKGRKNYGPCTNEFQISLIITYRTSA